LNVLQENLKIRIYKTIILPVEEHRLRVFENRVLRRIFGPKRDEIKGEWRKSHNEELRDLYPSPSIVRMNKSRRMREIEYFAILSVCSKPGPLSTK
jgi:hypothetical protein